MDVLLARSHILGEKCKDTSAVWSDVCDALRGEGAIDYLSLFLSLFLKNILSFFSYAFPLIGLNFS